MATIGRYEIHPGSRPRERRVYARLNNGELRRLNREQTQILLLRHDINQLNKERISMRNISINRKKFIFFVIAAVMLIVALTVNFPSF